MSASKEEQLFIQVTGSHAPPAELPSTGMLVIGSSREKAQLLVEGQGVADVHCAIGRARRGGWAVKDLGSDFGTLLNGERVSQARLRAGDRIVIGSRRLVVLAPVAEPPAATPERSAEPAPPRAPAPLPPPAAPAPEPAIPGYRIVRLLGRGAMGAVYLAVQESLEREVALKALPQRLARDEDFVRRFQAEARAAAALGHPNVVTVHDVGQAGGQHYLTMEYMDRASLEERVAREGPLHWRQVLDVLHDAASGLVYAESRGIVHRDIKPANLMQNHSGATKIADLGLATTVEAESEESEEGGRRIFGTPHFISPEQVRGLKADCRSDLYSLGATAYRLLSGHTPFEGASSREILRAKLREDPLPIHDFVQDLPEEVEAIVARLMQREPDDRYPSASALLRDVDALRAGAGLPSAAPIAVAPARGRWMKIAVPVALAAVALAFVLSRGEGEGPGVSPAASPERGAHVSSVDPEPDATAGAAPGDPAPVAPRGTGIDDGARERIFELEAEKAWLELAQRDLAPDARSEALSALAAEYKGTTTATRAIEEAEAISARLAAEERELGERRRTLDELFGRLRAAAQLDASPLRAVRSLRAVAAVEGQALWEHDEEFRARRAALEDEVLGRALAGIEAELRRAAELERAGRFDELRPLLADLMGLTELPDLAAERTPKGTSRMLEIRRDLREKLDGFDELRARFAVGRARDDARELARGLGGPSGLEGELARLDLAAAEARFAALEERIWSGDARAWLAALREDARLAADALRSLGASWEQWRRRTVFDPRGRRGAFAEARGADASGVMLDAEGGPERVPWSAYGGQTSGLHHLFQERLARPYTPEELRGIAALLRLSAVTEAVQQSARMFDPSRRPRYTERDAAELVRLFDDAREWARQAGSSKELERERAAAEALAAGLRNAAEGAWFSAVVALERLLQEHEVSLLVRLLSDGSGVPVALNAPADAPPQKGEGAPDASLPASEDGASQPADDGDDGGLGGGAAEDQQRRQLR